MESESRARRKRRSNDEYPHVKYPGAVWSSEFVFHFAQQTRDVALDTRDSMFRIEDLLEEFAREHLPPHKVEVHEP